MLHLWVVAVLELDRHPDHNEGPDPRTLRWSTEPSHRSLILDMLHRDNQLIDSTIFVLKCMVIIDISLGPRQYLYLFHYCRSSDIAVVTTNFNVFSLDSVIDILNLYKL